MTAKPKEANMSCDKSSSRAFPMTTVTLVAGLTILASVGLPARSFADPPGRVARIGYTSGSVSFRAGSLDEWSSATVNYPLTIGDHVWTDRNSRAELQIGSTVIRIAPSTEFSLLNLDDRTAQLRVTQGAVSVRVRGLIEDEVVEIDTPNSAVSLVEPGLYRVDVGEAGDSSDVIVRHGEADVSAGGSSFPLRPEQSAVLAGLDAPQPDIRGASPFDDFEAWCLTRDRTAENAQSARYVSRDMIGYEDLDANGSWQVVGAYGPVWYPRVRAEWVPYRYGRWVWVDPWGWTWVDDAPWGFAPFHYGRWVFVSSRWAWVPGTIVARPVYAPALVAFVGGPGWSASFQFGSAPVAWFPLGPREVFVPAYRVSPVYVERVNVAHVTNVTNVTNINVTNITYVNRSVPGAVTAVPRDTFVRGGAVAGQAVAVSRDQIQAAPIVGTTAAVAPQRVSIVGQAQARVAVPPAAAMARQVMVRTAPPPPPAPFAAKQAILEQHPGQPVDAETENALRARGAANPTAHPLVRATAPMVAPPANRSTQMAPVQARPAAPPPSPAPVAPSVAPAPSPRAMTPGTAPAQPNSNPVGAVPRAPTAVTPAELAARHAQERTDLAARHAQERAAMQTQHDEEQRRAADARQREQLRQQHQQEAKALQDRQSKEREAVQKRQQEERKPRG
jgi:hypothetical protein